MNEGIGRGATIVLGIAVAEAEALKHYFVSVEHLAIALAKIEDATLLKLWTGAGIDPVDFRRQLRAHIPFKGPAKWAPRCLISPRAAH